jgi:dTDP-4-dehydrorhamnose reductase
MKILLFGSSGMLGNYVYNVLKTDFTVICIKHCDFDIEKDDWDKLKTILVNHLEEKDIIINCAGAIPQKNLDSEYKKYIRINTLFPHKLNEYANILHLNFIHITTDCVYDGLKGNYVHSDEHTATTIYGITKSLGESCDFTIIRTSIIGEELYHKKSLLEWVRSKKDMTISGYTNHYWNGVCCLTLANIIKQMIEQKLFWKGVKHIYSPKSVSKYELCNFINEIYNLNIEVIPMETPQSKDLTLLSNEPVLFEVPDIYTQIQEQKDYSFTSSTEYIPLHIQNARFAGSYECVM